MLLLATVGFIVWEAITRFKVDDEVRSNLVIIVASVGIVVNGITAWLFVKGKERDLNIKSAFLHFVADMLVSLGVVIAAVVIFFTGLSWIDPLISLMIAVFILNGTFKLLFDSINLSLDAVPKSIDIIAIQDYFTNHEKIKSFHDLHIWAMSTSETALTVHLVVEDSVDDDFIHKTTDYISSTFNINHCTIQVEQTAQESCTGCN